MKKFLYKTTAIILAIAIFAPTVLYADTATYPTQDIQLIRETDVFELYVALTALARYNAAMRQLPRRAVDTFESAGGASADQIFNTQVFIDMDNIRLSFMFTTLDIRHILRPRPYVAPFPTQIIDLFETVIDSRTEYNDFITDKVMYILAYGLPVHGLYFYDIVNDIDLLMPALDATVDLQRLLPAFMPQIYHSELYRVYRQLINTEILLQIENIHLHDGNYQTFVSRYRDGYFEDLYSETFLFLESIPEMVATEENFVLQQLHQALTLYTEATSEIYNSLYDLYDIEAATQMWHARHDLFANEVMVFWRLLESMVVESILFTEDKLFFQTGLDQAPYLITTLRYTLLLDNVDHMGSKEVLILDFLRAVLDQTLWVINGIDRVVDLDTYEQKAHFLSEMSVLKNTLHNALEEATNIFHVQILANPAFNIAQEYEIEGLIAELRLKTDTFFSLIAYVNTFARYMEADDLVVLENLLAELNEIHSEIISFVFEISSFVRTVVDRDLSSIIPQGETGQDWLDIRKQQVRDLRGYLLLHVVVGDTSNRYDLVQEIQSVVNAREDIHDIAFTFFDEEENSFVTWLIALNDINVANTNPSWMSDLVVDIPAPIVLPFGYVNHRYTWQRVPAVIVIDTFGYVSFDQYGEFVNTDFQTSLEVTFYTGE